MAAAEDSPLFGLTAAPAVAKRRTEALAWDAIRRIHYGTEEVVAYNHVEEPDEGGDSGGGRGSGGESGVR